jgi:hypothetical protein
MHPEGELFGFEDFMQKDNSPLDNTQITTTLLYYSQDELKEFKQLSKELIKKYYGEDYKDGNVSDLILKIFRNELR